MLETIAGPMLQDFLLMRKRRVITTALVLSLVFVGFEASTQFVAMWLLNRRIETTAALLQSKEASAAQVANLQATQGENIAELMSVQKDLHEPGTYLLRHCVRFLKGFWPALPVALLFSYLAFKVLPKMPDKLEVRAATLGFGFSAISMVLLFGTANGLISSYWNRSAGLLMSVVVFPVTSAIALMLFLGLWLFIGESPQQKPAS